MLNISGMKLAPPKCVWPDVQRLITSANSVVFKRVLAEEHWMCVYVCVRARVRAYVLPDTHKAASVSLAKYL